jgi:hypothetical protein
MAQVRGCTRLAGSACTGRACRGATGRNEGVSGSSLAWRLRGAACPHAACLCTGKEPAPWGHTTLKGVPTHDDYERGGRAKQWA